MREILERRSDQGTILVVAYEPAIRQLLQQLLAPEAYRVLAVTNGAEAVRIIR